MGYVFQYLTQTNYYPYYIPTIREAELIDEEGSLKRTHSSKSHSHSSSKNSSGINRHYNTDNQQDSNRGY